MNLFKRIAIILIGGTFVFSPLGCVKDNFNEPADPFSDSRLEANPEKVHVSDPASSLAIATNHSNITESQDGMRIQGSVFAKNDLYGDMKIANGDFIFLKDAAVKKLGKSMPSEHGDLPLSRGKYYRVVGDSIQTYSAMAAYCMLELPAYGMLSKITSPLSGGDLVGAKVTMGYGSKIKETFGSTFDPLNDSRQYFVFQMETGVGFDIGVATATLSNDWMGQNVDVGIGNASGYVIVLDPLDPFLYYVGGMGGMAIGAVEAGGFGFSVRGNLGYTPRANVKNFIPSFDNGYIYLLGDIPLPFPIADVNPAISGAEAVIRFEPGDFGAPIAFWDLLPVRYVMGLNGSLTVNPDIVPGFLSLSFDIADASAYVNWNNVDDFRVSFVGMANPIELPNPNVLLLDLTKNLLVKLGLPENSLSFVKYVRMAVAVQNPTAVLKENATFAATLSSRPKEWDFYLLRKTSLNIPGVGEIGAGIATYRLNPSLFKFLGTVTIGPFAGMELLGEIQWSNAADFTLKGHAWADVGGEWGPVGFHLAMELLAEIYKRQLTFGFHGLINLDGSCWVTILKKKYTVGAKFRLETRIESDGTFLLSFRIGIGPFGYTVEINYNKKSNGEMHEILTMKEIPLDQVPPEFRYEPDEGPIVLSKNYVHDYDTEYTIDRVVFVQNEN